jgi:hypothetical protein
MPNRKRERRVCGSSFLIVFHGSAPENFKNLLTGKQPVRSEMGSI